MLITVGVIVTLAVKLIEKDKTTYIYDLNSSVANTISQQINQILESKKEIIEEFIYFYTASKNKNTLEKRFYESNDDLISLSIWRLSEDSNSKEIKSITLEKEFFNTTSYEEGVKEALDNIRGVYPLNLSDLNVRQSAIINNTFSKNFPVSSVAFYSKYFSNVILVGDFSGSLLKGIFSQSDIYSIYLVNTKGDIIAHQDSELLQDRINMSKVKIVQQIKEQKNTLGVMEYKSIDEEAMLGAYALLDSWNSGVIIEVPKKMAFIGAKNLIKSLLTIVVIISAVAFILIIIFSRTLSNPIIKLSDATKEIAKGKFAIKIKPSTSDEIGNLAKDFNTMTNKLDDLTKQLIQSTKMASIGSMARSIGHEFGNVLGAIIGHADLILMDEPDENVSKSVQIIIDGAERASMIVQNLKGISKSEEKVLKEEQILSCLESAVLLAEPEYKKKGLYIAKDANEDFTVNIDQRQVSQVFLNMMINASHAMKRGGKMHISVYRNDKFVSIDFKDTGCGIPEENLEKIFEPLFTTKGDSGTGLGLAVSKEIIEGHDGSLNVSSVVGEGTTFVIQLPIMS